MTELGPSPLAAGDRQLSVADARTAIAAALQPITGQESVPLMQALGRVLAEDVLSPIDVPAHDNSAMDGYALRGTDLAPDGDTLMPVAGTGLAGQAFDGGVPQGA